MTAFALHSAPQSRSTLAAVVIAHVAAALLIVQMFEARRYIEPVPLTVSLLPAIQQARPDPVPEPSPAQFQPRVSVPEMPQPVPEVRPEPVPQPVIEREPLPEPVAPVRLEPKPLEREIVREPQTVQIPQPEPLQSLPEPPPMIVAESVPLPRPIPEPPPRAISEIPVPPAPPPQPVAAVALPTAMPVDVPAPPQLAELAAPAPSSSVAEKPEDVVMDSKMLTAVYLSNPKPLYPNVSRRLGEQGTVMLRIFVTIAGDPTEIQLKSSSGYPRLDRAALSAVRNWKFSPATRGNQAVDAWVLVPIRFSLKG